MEKQEEGDDDDDDDEGEVVSLGRGTEERVEKQRAEVSGILKIEENSEKRGRI